MGDTAADENAVDGEDVLQDLDLLDLVLLGLAFLTTVIVVIFAATY